MERRSLMAAAGGLVTLVSSAGCYKLADEVDIGNGSDDHPENETDQNDQQRRDNETNETNQTDSENDPETANESRTVEESTGSESEKIDNAVEVLSIHRGTGRRGRDYIGGKVRNVIDEKIDEIVVEVVILDEHDRKLTDEPLIDGTDGLESGDDFRFRVDIEEHSDDVATYNYSVSAFESEY